MSDGKRIHGWLEITTPFVDRHNDYLQIYATQEHDRYLLTDDGYIIEDLEQSGYTLDTLQSKTILETVLSGFGIHRRETELMTYATAENFSARMHSLLQAMLTVSTLFSVAPQS
jgi:hypothetical protein